MAQFKKVGGPRTYVKFSECKVGDVLVEGKYIGTVANQFNKDKPNYEFKPLNGEANVVLNSAGKLVYLMDTYVQVGDLVQVTYKGKSKIDKGPMKGKEAHDFEVAVDDSAREQMSPAPSVDNSQAVDLNGLD